MEAIKLKAYTKDAAQVNAIKAFLKALNIKYELVNDSPYDPDFVEKIMESRTQAAEGNSKKIDLDDLWK